MLGPFTQERQEQLVASAQEFVKQFAKEYSKMFALAMLQRIEAEVKGEDLETRLQYRDFSSIERPYLFEGVCYMKQGEGPGAWSKWKRVYLVEQQDYNLAVYQDQKTYAAGKKPSLIRISGYSLEKQPASFYRSEMRHLAAGIGVSEAELEVMTSMSQYAWALAHPWRTNYVFQLHQGRNALCPCFGGNTIEPDNLGAEFASEREQFLEVFDRCVSNVSPRDVDSVSGKGFDLTVGKMSSNFESLSGFTDDGLESEILVDMLLEECLTPIRDDMIQDLMGPVSMKLVAWYKTRALVQISMQKVADPAWGQMQKAAEQLGQKMEPKVKQGIEPILKVKEGVKQKIKENLTDKLGEALAEYVTPHIDPLLKAFDKPMTKGFEVSKNVFSKMTNSALPAGQNERNTQLDSIARAYDELCDVRDAADEVVAPLEQLKSSSGDIFSDLDPHDLRNQALQSMLETLDAAAYTVEQKMEEGTQQDDAVNQVIQDYAHDVIVARSNFVSDVVKSILITAFRKAIGPVADPVIESLDGLIPEDLRDFVSVAAIFEELVDMFVGDPIQKMVEGAYPRPK